MRESNYLGLKIIEDNDKPSWTGEFDYNFEKVDTAVGEMSSGTSSIIGTLETRIDNLENTTATHDTHIGVNTSSIAALNMDYVSFKTNQQAVNESDDGRLDVLESNSLIIGTDMSNLKKEMERTSSIVAVAEQKVDVMETKVNSVSSGLVTVQGNVNQLENDFDGLETTVNGFDGRITSAQNNVNTLENDFDALETTVNGFDGRITSAQNNANSRIKRTFKSTPHGSLSLTVTFPTNTTFESKLLVKMVSVKVQSNTVYDDDYTAVVSIPIEYRESQNIYMGFIIMEDSLDSSAGSKSGFLMIQQIEGASPSTINAGSKNFNAMNKKFVMNFSKR